MKNIIGTILACIILHSVSLAGNFTWTGTTNTNWNTSTNWVPNGVPGTSDSININSTTNSLILTSNKSVRRLIMNSGVLNLGGDTLTITITSGLNGGSINNGLFKTLTSGLINFNGTTFGAQVSAKGQIKLNGCVFNNTAYFEHSSSAAGTGAGGNTFNGVTTLKNAGTTTFRLAGTNPDTYNNDVYFSNVANSGSSNFQISYGATSYFNGNVEVSSTSNFGVSFSSGGTGSSILASGKTISIGSAGLVGTLVIQNFTQTGTTAQSLTLAGVLNISNSTFNGAFTSSSANLLLSGSNFYGQCSFTKTGSSSDYSYGNNHFYSDATFNNNSTTSAILRLASTAGDTYDGNVALNTSTGYIQGAYADTNDFKGNISINNAKVTFNNNWGSVRFNGSNSQVISGSADYLISKLLINKTSGNVTFQNSVTIDTLLNLHAGVLVFDATKSITLKAITQVTEMSPLSYIDGLVKKIGNTAFTFPVGDSNEYRPVSISAPSNSTDAFVAQYFKQQQTQGSTLDTGVNYISNCNYWNVDRVTGSSNVSLGFQWFDNTCDVFDIDSIRLMNFNSGVWKNRGQMAYTGNDSVGTLSSNGSIQNFGMFTYGHNLFPRLMFEANYDSTLNPVLVTFTNSSRGIPSGSKYYFLHGDTLFNGSSIDSLANKGQFFHLYPRFKDYTPLFYTIINGDTISTSKAFSLLSVASCTVHYEFSTNNTPHPGPGPHAISACYDELIIVVDIDDLANDVGLHELEILFPSSVLANGVVGSCTSNPSAGISITPVPDGFEIDYTTTGGALYSGQIELKFYLNNCALFTTISEIFEFDFNLLSATALQTVNFNTELDDEFSAPLVDPTGTSANYELSSIVKPLLEFDNLSTTTNTYSTYDIVTREYDIVPKEGIIDMFTFSLNIEEEAELLSLEVIDINGINPPYVLYNSPPAIPTGIDYRITFVGPMLTPLSPPTPLNAPTSLVPLSYLSTTEIRANLGTAITTTNLNAWSNGLYWNNLSDFNYIRIRETLRIVKVTNCTNIINTNNTASEYSLEIDCDKDFQTTNCNERVGGQNLQCRVESISVGFTPNLLIPNAYALMTSNSIEPCSTNNYVVLIKNHSSNPSSCDGCGTMRLSKIVFEIDLKHFEYDELWYGDLKIDNAAINTVGNILTIDLNQIPLGDWINPNPQWILSGVSNKLNGDFPVGQPAEYWYLPPGGEIGILFEGLRLIDCSMQNPNYDFAVMPHDPFFLTDEVFVYYDNICGNVILPASSGQSVQFGNYFNGYTTSSAKPLDLPDPITGDVLNLTFNFTNTSNAQGSVQNYFGTYNPWQLMKRSSPHTQVLNCPNLNYYAVLNFPIATAYTMNEIQIFDSKNGTLIADLNGNLNNITYTFNSNVGQIVWTWGVLSPTADLRFEIEVEIQCNGLIGIDVFELEYRSTCNNSCDPCLFYTYATEKASISKHCPDNCESYVRTEFGVDIKRTTAGWQSESDFVNSLPTIPLTTQGPAWNNVYPCDVVHVRAEGASLPPLDLAVPRNITLDELYFEFLVSNSAIPLTLNDRLFFDVNPGSTSGFFVTPTSPTCSCANQQFFVSIAQADIQNMGLTPDLDNRIRFRANMNSPIQCGGLAITLEQLLEDYHCNLLFEADLIIEDLPLTPNYYEADLIRGLFSALGDDTFLEESCDPWSTHLTYLKTFSTNEEKVTGPFNPWHTYLDQCDLIYQNTASVDGGFPLGDDFPNEFRPVLVYPVSIPVTHSNEFSLISGGIQATSLSPLIPYSAFGVNQTLTNLNTPTKIGIDKTGLTQRIFYSILSKKECPIIPPVTAPATPLLDIPLCNVIQTNCGTPLNCIEKFYAITINGVTPELFDKNILSFSFLPGNPFNSNYVSTPPIPISIHYFNDTKSSKAPNTWVYFKAVDENGIALPNVVFRLLNNNQQNLVPIQTNSGNFVFKTGDIIKSTITNFSLIVDWRFQTLPPCSSKITINAYYGVDCSGSDINLQDIENSNCVSLISDDFSLNVPAADLDVSIIAPPIPNGFSNCDYLPVNFRVESLEGDLSSAFFEVTATLPLALIWANSNYSIDGSVYNLPIQLPTPFISQINNTKTYKWNLLSLISYISTISSVPTQVTDHFNVDNAISFIDFHLNFQMINNGMTIPGTFSITYEVNGTGTCGAIVTDAPAPLSNSYFGVGVTPVSINSIGNLCNGTSTVTLSVSPSTIGSLYSWQSGGVQLSTSSTFNPTFAGTYTVTVTDPSGCSTSALFVLIDDVPAFNLSPNPSHFCQTTGIPITLTNTLDNGYTYLWSSGSNNHPVSVNSANLNGSVTITGTNGCTVSTNYVIPATNPTVSISNLSGTVDYCYPNPGIMLQAVASPSPGYTYSYQWLPINATSPNVQFFPNATTTYSVNATNNFGCPATANVTLNNIAPPINIAPNPAYGCIGDQVQLSENTCVGCSYNWSNGSTSSTSNYLVNNLTSFAVLTVTELATGCQSTQGSLIEPVVPIIQNLNPVVISPSGGSPVTISVSASNCLNCTYQWTEIQNGVLVVISTTNSCIVGPSTTQNYQVLVTGSDPTGTVFCSSTSSVLVVISVPSNSVRLCDPQINPITQIDINNSIGNSFTFNAGVTYQINEDLEFNNKTCLIAPGANLEFADNTGIYLSNGMDLFIDNGAHLYSCNNVVWSGIHATTGSLISMRGTGQSPVLIEDADIAIEAEGLGTTILLQGIVTFNANNIGIYMHDGDFSTSSFRGTRFTCNKLMKFPYNSNSFSNAHIKAKDATFVNLNLQTPGLPFSNEFENAMYCLDFVRTGVFVDGCRFRQPIFNNINNALNPSGIKFEGEDVNQPNRLHHLRVGSHNSPLPDNSFDNCIWGISARGRAMIDIYQNEFRGCNFGIGITKNETSVISGMFGSVDIFLNRMDNTIENGIDIMDNGIVNIRVIANQINFGPTSTFASETRRGIFVHNSADYLNANLDISNNFIRYCRTGIQLMQQERGRVLNNEIVFEIGDADLDYANNIFRRGTIAQNTRGINFIGNQISRTAPIGQTISLTNNMIELIGTQRTLLCGFSEETSSNTYLNNTTSSLPTHIRVFGSCLGSIFSCNNLDLGIQGFKLEGGAAVISSQGTSAVPNGNRWLNWPTINDPVAASRIIGNAQLQPITWYRSQAANEDPTDNNTLPIPGGIINISSPVTSCVPSPPPCPDCAQLRLNSIVVEADRITTDDVAQFNMRQYVFEELKDSFQLMNSGSIFDVDLQNFFSAMASNNVGYLENIDDLLKTGDYTNANIINEELIVSKLMETNLKMVNEICSQFGHDFRTLDSLSISVLEMIAYQNPIIGGVAVYRARAILGIDVEDSQSASRMMPFTKTKEERKVSIVPNPSTGLFTVYLNDEEDTQIQISVFNATNQLILSPTSNNGSLSFSINLTSYPVGVYHVKIKWMNGYQITKKIVLLQGK